MTSPVRKVSLIISLVCCWVSAAHAQMVTFSQERAHELIALAESKGAVLILSNGLMAQHPTGHTPVMQLTDKVKGRQLSHFVYSLLAARLIDQGVLKADSPIYPLFPDYDLGEFFAVSITPRLMMSETSGFEVPPFYTGLSGGNPSEALTVGDYVRTIRSASTRTQDDPVATLMLIRTLEKTTGKSISDILTQDLLAPLNLAAGDIQITPDPAVPSLFAPVLNLELSMRAALTVGQALNGHLLDRENRPFLTGESEKILKDQIIYAHHPMGMMRSGGVTSFAHKGQMITTPTLYCSDTEMKYGNASLFSVDGQRFVTLLLSSPAAPCSQKLGLDLMKTIIEKDMAGAKDHSRWSEVTKAVTAMSEGEERPLGLYLADQTPSHWVTDRLMRIREHSLSISPMPGSNSLLLSQVGKENDPQIYQQISAYHYRSAGGSDLIFSRSFDGGYLDFDGKPYRLAGFLGNKKYMSDLYPLLILLPLSAFLYCRSTTSPGWRRMAYVVGISAFVFAITTELEKAYAIPFYYEQDLAWIIPFWRFPLNFAMMGLFTMPFFAMRFSKSNQMPTKPVSLVLTNLHLTLMSLASVALFLWAMAINISGEFFP